MIISLFVRHYKIYQGAKYIRLRNIESDNNVSIYLGDNAVGKSSILEALDTYFNESDWQRTLGTKTNEAFISPFFVIDKVKLNNFLSDNFKLIDFGNNRASKNSILEIITTIDSMIRKGYELNKTKDYNELYEEMRVYSEDNQYKNHYLLLIPLYYTELKQSTDNSISYILPNEREQLSKENWEIAYRFIINYYKYVYFKVEENPYETLHLENASFQRLMNKDILSEIEVVLNKKNPETNRSTIESMNNSLSEYLDNINGILTDSGGDYRFTYKPNQPNKITARHMREIVISRFLSVRTLKEGSKDLKDLSSGEQRKALIHVSTAFIEDAKNNLVGELVLAIDEPENSLHIKNLYDQFNSLISLSKYCQVIITTHWYGILPILGEESLHIVHKHLDEHRNNIEIQSFKAEKFFGNNMNFRVKDASNILIKSYFDLTNSIITMQRQGTNFIVCEGLTDKRYIEYYAKKVGVMNNNLHIIAVGGIANVTKLYRFVYLGLKEISKSTQDVGKILFITDLDQTIPKLEVDNSLKIQNEEVLSIKSLIYDEKDNHCTLEPYNENSSSITLDMEDCLEPQKLYSVIKSILSSYDDTAKIGQKLNFNFKREKQHSKIDDELDSIFDKSELSRDEIKILNSIFAQDSIIEDVKSLTSTLYTKDCDSKANIPNVFSQIFNWMNLNYRNKEDNQEYKFEKNLSIEENLKAFFSLMEQIGIKIDDTVTLPNQRTRNIYSIDGMHNNGKKYIRPIKINYFDEIYILEGDLSKKMFLSFVDYMKDRFSF